MPIRLVNVSPTVGRIAPVLGDFGGDVAGSFLAPGAFDGDLFSVLQPYTSEIVGNYAQSSVRTGTIASTMAGFTGAFRPPVAITSNAGRINTLLAGRSPHFAYSTPADPVTTRDVTVTSAAQFNAEASTGGAIIRINTSFSGDIVLRSNCDVIMSNSATITGNLTLGGFGNRCTAARWTGGNINGRLLGNNFQDVLFDDFNLDMGTTFSDLTAANNRFDRIAFLNTTIRNSGFNQTTGWALFVLQRSTADQHTNMILGNTKIIGDGLHIVRLQSITNILMFDTVINPEGTAGTSALRFHLNCQNVWVRDHWQRQVLKVDQVNSSDPGPGFGNGLFDNFRLYGDAFAFDFGLTNQNSGEIRNSTFFRSGGSGTVSIAGVSDGGGNQTIAWDGVTVPDSSQVGAIR